jgi:hypothetical protein
MKIADQLSSRVKPKSGGAAYMHLQMLSGDQKPNPITGITGEQQFLAMSKQELWKEAPNMTPEEFKELDALHTKMNDKTANPEDITQNRLFSQTMNEVFAEAHLYTDEATGKPLFSLEKNQILERVQTQLNGWEMNNAGKSPPVEVIRAAARDAVKKNAEGKLTELDIPAGHITSIRQADKEIKALAYQMCINNKIIPTEEAIRIQYNAIIADRAKVAAPLKPSSDFEKRVNTPILNDKGQYDPGEFQFPY